MYKGDQCTAIHGLHERFGPIVRVSPNEIDISDGEALWPIYMDKGGFAKSPIYRNFDIDGHTSMFSTLSLDERAPTAKAVLPMFSSASIRSASQIITRCAEEMVERLKREAGTGRPVNVLNLTRSYAIDAVTSIVFGRNYGGINEPSSQLSVSACVDGFVGVGQFLYLHPSLFAIREQIATFLWPNKKMDDSTTHVNKFISEVVRDSKDESHTYQGRIAALGASNQEINAQCKDVLFAGTDSTGNNLATLCWFLANDAEKYRTLKTEVDNNAVTGAELQSLPYLNGAIKEALRLSMAISCRLPRLTPPEGWTYGEYHIPANTRVGVAAFELHLNPKVFPSPHEFLPERWLKATTEMHRDWLPFGKGARSCIARNLALQEMFVATECIVKSNILESAKPVEKKIEIHEWFNCSVKGEKIELIWPSSVV
ncbi:Pisatin demethylase 15 [Phlyctema vagabunda]|uniref:Pisatin demethylase 15 n=1 Tax=Phlyctema vagabunda TaxID=108571 RepID=A0ABR4PCI4_9HELO